jgi:hypothetical protein
MTAAWEYGLEAHNHYPSRPDRAARELARRSSASPMTGLLD